MEESHRLHKDVPFGWVLSLQRLMSQGAPYRVDQSTSPWRLDEAKRHLLPDDLHNLAAPR